MRNLIISSVIGVSSAVAQIPLEGSPVPPWAQALSGSGLLMFAIWWLSKQNTKITQDASADKKEMALAYEKEKSVIKSEHDERFTEMRDEYKSQVAELKAEVRELRGFILRAFEGLDVSKSIKRAQLELKKREDDNDA